jgi:hypothetical protein
LKIKAFNIEEDGLETVKNQGRHDVNNLWQEIEDYWVEAIRNGVDDKYGTIKLIDPKEGLSYPEPEVEVVLHYEDFMKTALEYQMFQEGIDSSIIKTLINETIKETFITKLYSVDTEQLVKQGE